MFLSLHIEQKIHYPKCSFIIDFILNHILHLQIPRRGSPDASISAGVYLWTSTCASKGYAKSESTWLEFLFFLSSSFAVGGSGGGVGGWVFLCSSQIIKLECIPFRGAFGVWLKRWKRAGERGRRVSKKDRRRRGLRTVSSSNRLLSETSVGSFFLSFFVWETSVSLFSFLCSLLLLFPPEHPW